MSLILSGKQGLSLSKATLIAERLGLTDKEQEVFLCSVESQHGRSKALRKIASQKLALAEFKFEKQQVQILKNWLVLPILDYLRTHPLTSLRTLEDIFEISPYSLHKLIDYLTDHKILMFKKGHWIVKKNFLAFGDDIPSNDVRQYHKETLARAARALEEQTMNERLISSTVFNIDPLQKAQAFQVLSDFRRKFCVDFYPSQKREDQSEVYCLSIQFFKTHRGSK